MKDEKNGIETILGNLIEKQKIPKKAVYIAAKIPDDQVDKYLSGDFKGIRDKDIRYLNELSMLIGQGLNLVDPDERVKGILETLISVYGFDINQLSRLLNIKAEILQKMLSGEEVALEDKYALAVSSAYLFYALKKPE